MAVDAVEFGAPASFQAGAHGSGLLARERRAGGGGHTPDWRPSSVGLARGKGGERKRGNSSNNDDEKKARTNGS